MRFRYLLELGQTGLSVAFDLPTQLGYDSDDPVAQGEVGRTGVAIDSIEDMRVVFDGIPLDRVSTSMTINAPAALLLLLYELAAEEQGVPGEQAPRHGPERHPQGVHRPRELHLPAAAVDADHDRPLRLLRGAAAALQHDLHLRLPHPRGGLDGRSGARVHDRERHRVLRGGGRGRPLARRVRRARLVLLQRPQRLSPGGGEVPRGAAPVGPRDARAVRRHEPEGARAALPRADGRLDAHRPAAGAQHRPRRDPGAGGRLRRRPVAAHELVRRGARAADRAGGEDRAAHAAGAPARGGDDTDGRSAGRLVRGRGADAASSRRRPGSSSSASTSWAAPSRPSSRGSCSRRSRRRRSASHGTSSAASASWSASTATWTTATAEVELQRIDPEIERRQLERTARVRAERDAGGCEPRARGGAKRRRRHG